MYRCILLSAAFACLSLTVSAQKYKVKSIQHERITIDSRLDSKIDSKAVSFMKPYKKKVDEIMAPVVGHCARNMRSETPESEMSNLLPDILVWSALRDYNEKVDFAIYNIGGIRSTFSKGEVTQGDVVDVAPFENKICFITLKGSDVLELFQQIARRHGEGVSEAVRAVITKDGKLVSVTINGKPVDPNASYRIATIDYLIEGNDGMLALRKGTNVVSPSEEKNNTRFIIMDYFREAEKRGEVVDAEVEGRMVETPSVTP